MSKLSLAGLVSLVTGLTMIIFKSIASLTSVKMTFPDSTIEDFLSPQKLDWIDSMAQGFTYDATVYLITVPVYVYLIVIGIVLLVISGLLGK